MMRHSLGLIVLLALALMSAGWVRVQDQKTAEAADPTAAARNRMVQRHLVERGIKNPRVLDAFRTVPRHKFLPHNTRRQPYDDESIPIGEGQTITPPYDVAFMTEVLDPQPTDKVYEVGTGSGYQSAILSRLVKDVYSVEIHAPLSERATAVHKELGYTNIHTRVGDAYGGWPDGHSAGRPVHPKHPPGHQAGRQADRQGAQAHTFCADDRQGTQGEGRGRSGSGSGCRSGSTPAQARGRRHQAQELRRMKSAVAFLLLALAFLASPALAQEPEIERPGPPAVDDLEQDANKDGIPDGWYNAREAIWEAKGGIVGPHYVRFACTQRGRPARLSRAFGVDGRKTEAIILGLWIKLDNIQYGERDG